MTRRVLLRMLAGAAAIVAALRVVTRRPGAEEVEVGGPGGPVLTIVPLPEGSVGGPSDLAG